MTKLPPWTYHAYPAYHAPLVVFNVSVFIQKMCYGWFSFQYCCIRNETFLSFSNVTLDFFFKLLSVRKQGKGNQCQTPGIKFEEKNSKKQGKTGRNWKKQEEMGRNRGKTRKTRRNWKILKETRRNGKEQEKTGRKSKKPEEKY